MQESSALNILVHEYLIKRRFYATAKTFKAETGIAEYSHAPRHHSLLEEWFMSFNEVWTVRSGNIHNYSMVSRIESVLLRLENEKKRHLVLYPPHIQERFKKSSYFDSSKSFSMDQTQNDSLYGPSWSNCGESGDSVSLNHSNQFDSPGFDEKKYKCDNGYFYEHSNHNSGYKEGYENRNSIKGRYSRQSHQAYPFNGGGRQFEDLHDKNQTIDRNDFFSSESKNQTIKNIQTSPNNYKTPDFPTKNHLDQRYEAPQAKHNVDTFNVDDNKRVDRFLEPQLQIFEGPKMKKYQSSLKSSTEKIRKCFKDECENLISSDLNKISEVDGLRAKPKQTQKLRIKDSEKPEQLDPQFHRNQSSIIKLRVDPSITQTVETKIRFHTDNLDQKRPSGENFSNNIGDSPNNNFYSKENTGQRDKQGIYRSDSLSATTSHISKTPNQITIKTNMSSTGRFRDNKHHISDQNLESEMNDQMKFDTTERNSRSRESNNPDVSKQTNTSSDLNYKRAQIFEDDTHQRTTSQSLQETITKPTINAITGTPDNFDSSNIKSRPTELQLISSSHRKNSEIGPLSNRLNGTTDNVLSQYDSSYSNHNNPNITLLNKQPRFDSSSIEKEQFFANVQDLESLQVGKYTNSMDGLETHRMCFDDIIPIVNYQKTINNSQINHQKNDTAPYMDRINNSENHPGQQQRFSTQCHSPFYENSKKNNRSYSLYDKNPISSGFIYDRSSEKFPDEKIEMLPRMKVNDQFSQPNDDKNMPYSTKRSMFSSKNINNDTIYSLSTNKNCQTRSSQLEKSEYYERDNDINQRNGFKDEIASYQMTNSPVSETNDFIANEQKHRLIQMKNNPYILNSIFLSPIRSIKLNTRNIMCTDIATFNGFMAMGSDQGHVYFLDLLIHECTHQIYLGDFDVSRVKISEKLNYCMIFCALSDASIRMIRFNQKDRSFELISSNNTMVHKSPISGLDVTYKSIITADSHNNLIEWTNEGVFISCIQLDNLQTFCCVEDGVLLISDSESVYIFDFHQGVKRSQVLNEPAHTIFKKHIVFQNVDYAFFILGCDSSVVLLDQNLALVTTFSINEHYTSATITSASSLLLGLKDGVCKIDSFKKLSKQRTDDSVIIGIEAFSTDDRETIVTCTIAGKVEFWTIV